MKLKTYTAATMAEAMRLVRDEMGDEAIIVSTHNSSRGRGVQVTAALEEIAAEDALRASLAQDRPENGVLAETVEQALSYHGVPEPIILRLLRAVRRHDGDDAVEALAGAIDDYIDFAAVPRGPESVCMLVGPPGAGKTTIAAKIAAQAAMAGEPVSLISTDTVRAGAIEQLAAYARVMEQDLATAERPEELGALLRLARGQNLILIDTPGANPFSEDEMADARRFLCAEGIMPILVLPAGLDAADAADSARIFAGLGCRRLIVTRLDVTRRYGALLAAADAGEMAICGASIASSIAHGMKSLSPVSLARLLLRDPTQAHGDEAGDGPYEFEDEA